MHLPGIIARGFVVVAVQGTHAPSTLSSAPAQLPSMTNGHWRAYRRVRGAARSLDTRTQGRDTPRHPGALLRMPAALPLNEYLSFSALHSKHTELRGADRCVGRSCEAQR